MLFHTLDYLVFLPALVLAYWAAPRRWRLALLAAGSAFFYGSWNPAYLVLLLFVIAVAWAGGLALAADAGRTRRLLVLGVLLLPLLFFKYWNWIAWNLEALAGLAGWPLVLPREELPLPVGISFFTFQALAYVVDVGRAARGGPAGPLGDDGEPLGARDLGPDPAGVGPERSLLRFGTFLGFFPQLVAGPIVRRHELMPQLARLPLLRRDQVGEGVVRIARGMFKKVVLADVVRLGMVDPVFADPGRFTGLELLVGLYAYTLQIYCDFSGYTDIAIGSARLFGIELPENFRRPYKATSVAGFWRRWHITLSNWVRDYIYYPLGGSRVSGGQWKVYRNILLTLVIIGIWHGASWNFVVYGTLHGLAVAVNRYQRKRTGRRPDDPLPGRWAWAWRWALTFHFVVLARVLFRAPDLDRAWTLFAGLFDASPVLPRFAPTAWAVLALGYALHFTPDDWAPRAERWVVRRGPLAWAVLALAVAAGCVYLGAGERLAFVYYQF